MEAGSSHAGGVRQVRRAASPPQNVPGVRQLQRPRGQGRQVCGREISSVVPLQEGSAASLLFFTAPTLFVMGSIKIHRFTLCSWAAILYCACVSRQKTV